MLARHAGVEIMQTAEKLKTQQAARSLVYRRLADAFRRPEPGLSAILEELETAFAHLGSDARKDSADLKESYGTIADVNVLLLDYTALFMGPFLAPAPPYGSIYLEEKRRLMGDSTVDARQHYLSLGLDLSGNFKEAPDHICAELEFMHVLVEQARQAIDAMDHEALADNLRQQRTFLSHHLGAWVPAFSAQMLKHAQTRYYQCLAAVTRTFIAEEIELLPDL
jgi:putative dimethyl sulfoxide reductase chaperone